MKVELVDEYNSSFTDKNVFLLANQNKSYTKTIFIDPHTGLLPNQDHTSLLIDSFQLETLESQA